MFFLGMPLPRSSSTNSPSNSNAEDNQGWFWSVGTKKEWGYQVLLVACGANRLKSPTSKCEDRESMSPALLPLPCNRIKTLLPGSNSLPAAMICSSCMIDCFDSDPNGPDFVHCPPYQRSANSSRWRLNWE